MAFGRFHRFLVLGPLVVWALAGCGKHLTAPQNATRLPAPQITAEPVRDHDRIVAFRARWSGADPTQRIDHYLVAIDPTNPETIDANWHPSYAGEMTVSMGTARTRRTVAVRSVDALGEMSPATWRVMSTTNVPPVVFMTTPCASNIDEPLIPTSFRFTWTGLDPDGIFTQHPVKYRYRLFHEGSSEVPFDVITSNPDSLRGFYAPFFAGWDSLPGESTSVSYSNLVPNTQYAFAVVAVDEAGGINMPFSRNDNVSIVQVANPGITGPQLGFSAPGLVYFYPAGGFQDVPATHVKTYQVADQPITIRWYATPRGCSKITRMRWAVDIAELSDPSPRSNEATDWKHWSAWSSAYAASFGPYHPLGLKKELHTFYLEAEDSYGWVSLGILDVIVSRADLGSELLVVDDTRRKPDQVSGTNRVPPSGPWPTAAELDTFLFARGGMPWQGYPAGTLSPTGLFAGYAFDTLGTRTLTNGLVPIEILSAYRHVIWMTDVNGAINTQPPGSVGTPMSALKGMSQPGQLDVLTAYVRQGGQLWLLGGAAGDASLIARNRGSNDGPWLTFEPSLGELVPGSAIYDLAHVQSKLSFGTFTNPAIVRSSRAVGGWAGAPDYSQLPPAIETKSLSSDPIPPLRTASDFYNLHPGLEWVSGPNTIVEDLDPSPTVLRRGASLDTLYGSGASGLPSAPAVNACMLYYHGLENPPLIYAGFDVWNYQRNECMSLVDFVLQQIWKLPRQPIVRGLTPTSKRSERTARR